MKIIEPSYKVTFHVPEGYETLEQFLEEAGRTCYKSESKITDDSAGKFVGMLMNHGHMAMLEHCVATVRFIADRGFTHELVRHRIASFAQESTRYCNYSKNKFGSEITVVAQPGLFVGTPEYEIWRTAMEHIENWYMALIDLGVKPQIARSVLPIGLKTEIVMTANLREWHTVFGLRADKPAHPIMRRLASAVLAEFAERIPAMFMELKCILSQETNEEIDIADKALRKQIKKLESKMTRDMY